MAIEELDPAAAKGRQDDGWTYVDVRTPEEFAAGHPAGAINVPVAFMVGGAMQGNPNFVSEIQGRFSTDANLVMGLQVGRPQHDRSPTA